MGEKSPRLYLVCPVSLLPFGRVTTSSSEPNDAPANREIAARAEMVLAPCIFAR